MNADQRRPVRFFVSYAHDDQEMANDLLDELHSQLRASARYQYSLWNDGMLAIGEDWHVEIQNAAEAADFGLLLVTPSFLTSEYIGRHELPVFLEGKRCLPVGLKLVDFQRHNLKGLEVHQIFLCSKKPGDQSEPYSRFVERHERESFAHHLFLKIEERMDRVANLPLPNPGPIQKPPTRKPKNRAIWWTTDQPKGLDRSRIFVPGLLLLVLLLVAFSFCSKRSDFSQARPTPTPPLPKVEVPHETLPEGKKKIAERRKEELASPVQQIQGLVSKAMQ